MSLPSHGMFSCTQTGQANQERLIETDVLFLNYKTRNRKRKRKGKEKWSEIETGKLCDVLFRVLSDVPVPYLVLKSIYVYVKKKNLHLQLGYFFLYAF